MLRQRRAEFPECKGRASSSRCRLLRPQVCYKRGPSYPPEDTHQPVDLRPRGPGCHCRRRRRRDINGVFVVIVDSSIPVSPLRPPRQRRPATLAVSRGTLLLVPAARHRRLPEPLRDHCGRGRGGCLVIPVPLCAAASDVKSVPCRSPHLLMQRRPRPAAEDDAVAIFKAKERKRRGMRDSRVFTPLSTVQPPRRSTFSTSAPSFPIPLPGPTDNQSVSQSETRNLIKESSLAPSENTRRPGRNVKERNGRKRNKERSLSDKSTAKERREKRAWKEPL